MFVVSNCRVENESSWEEATGTSRETRGSPCKSAERFTEESSKPYSRFVWVPKPNRICVMWCLKKSILEKYFIRGLYVRQCSFVILKKWSDTNYLFHSCAYVIYQVLFSFTAAKTIIFLLQCICIGTHSWWISYQSLLYSRRFI